MPAARSKDGRPRRNGWRRPLIDTGIAETRVTLQAHQGGRCRPASPSRPPDQRKQQCGVLMNAIRRFYETPPKSPCVPAVKKRYVRADAVGERQQPAQQSSGRRNWGSVGPVRAVVRKSGRRGVSTGQVGGGMSCGVLRHRRCAVRVGREVRGAVVGGRVWVPGGEELGAAHGQAVGQLVERVPGPVADLLVRLAGRPCQALTRAPTVRRTTSSPTWSTSVPRSVTSSMPPRSPDSRRVPGSRSVRGIRRARRFLRAKRAGSRLSGRSVAGTCALVGGEVLCTDGSEPPDCRGPVHVRLPPGGV